MATRSATLLLLVLCVAVVALDPPIWPDSFDVAFDETFIVNNVSHHVNGIYYYDAAHNRSRLDRFDGIYSKFCSSLAENVSTPCTELVVNQSRWIIYPQKSQCCFCCDSAHGCGILKKDWLKGADYLGDEIIDGANYNKWNQQGVVGYNHYWSSTDGFNVPRRLDENGGHIFDYIIKSYSEKPLDAKIFALPQYCKDPCPDTSFCGKHRAVEYAEE